jgi:hypothetical protein
MLVFPSLGSQAEVSQNRPKDSECPWNTIMYRETPVTSIYFSAKVSEEGTPKTSQGADKKVVSGQRLVDSELLTRVRDLDFTAHWLHSGVSNTACVVPLILTSALHKICPASLIAKAPVME